MKPVRTIKYVARQTGLSVHVIRVWEKRYRAVQPTRAANNRRLYTEEDVERLRLLREATQAGHSIGQIGTASLSQLQRLVREAAPAPPSPKRGRAAATPESHAQRFTQALVAIENLDAPALSRLLDQAAVEMGSPAVLQKFIAPLAERVGDLWRDGELTIAHEHFATGRITEFLSAFARPYAENISAPHHRPGHAARPIA